MPSKIKSGKELREFRAARGWTQKQLAAELGISRNFLSEIESGVYRVPEGIREQLALIGGDAPPKSRPVVARLLENFGISARDFAHQINRSEAQLRSVLDGNRPPKKLQQEIEKWCVENLGVPKKILFKKQEEPPMEAVELTETARARFRIFADPFSAELEPTLFFGEKKNEWPEMAEIEKALRDAYLGQRNVALRGQVGSGKSTLNRRILGQFESAGEPVFIIEPEIIDKALLRPSLILERIIRACNIEDTRISLGGSLEERSERAKAALITVADRGLRAVLLIEEAHLLPDDTIKHFKTMSEWYRGVDKLLSVVMIGQPELDQKIKRWTNRQWFSRCVTVRMPGLGKRIPNYIAFRCEAKGVDPDKIFTADGLKAIQDRMATQTYDTPLLVGNFTKACMNRAAALGCKVDERVVVDTRTVLRAEKAEIKKINRKK